ncbi:MAG: VOC family protein [Opitutaceae bacterium]
MKQLKKLLALAGVLTMAGVDGSGWSLRAEEPRTPPLVRPRVLGLSHVAVKASDYEKSVAFYRDFLGFAEQGRLFYPTNGRRELVYLKISDTQTIEVFDAANVTQVAGQLYQIALQLEDAEALRVQFTRHGIRMPPVVGRGQMKNANFTTRDPNGYIIEVVQYLPEGRMALDRGKFLSDQRISDHLIAAGVATTKLPETLIFYRDILGFEERPSGLTGVSGSQRLRLGIPGSTDYVEVTVAPEDGTPYFCLEVPDLDSVKATLARRAPDMHYDRSLAISRAETGQRMLDVHDPDGMKIRLIEGGPVANSPFAPTKPPATP